MPFLFYIQKHSTTNIFIFKRWICIYYIRQRRYDRHSQDTSGNGKYWSLAWIGIANNFYRIWWTWKTVLHKKAPIYGAFGFSLAMIFWYTAYLSNFNFLCFSFRPLFLFISLVESEFSDESKMYDETTSILSSYIFKTI